MEQEDDNYQDDFEDADEINEEILPISDAKCNEGDPINLLENYITVEKETTDKEKENKEDNLSNDDAFAECAPENKEEPRNNQAEDNEYKDEDEHNSIEPEFDAKCRNLYKWQDNDNMPKKPKTISLGSKAICCNLDTFDPNNMQCRITSPRSLEIIRREGINVYDLYLLTKDQLKSIPVIRKNIRQ